MGIQLNKSITLIQGKFALLQAKISPGKVKIFYNFQVVNSPISPIPLIYSISHIPPFAQKSFFIHDL